LDVVKITIARPDTQAAAQKQVRDGDIAVQMHHALGPSGGSRGVQPECHIVERHGRILELIGLAVDEGVGTGVRVMTTSPYHDLRPVRQAAFRFLEDVEKRIFDNQHPAATVFDDVVKVGRHGPEVERDRDRAYLHGPEVGSDQIRAVVHEEQDPVIGLDPGSPEGVAIAIHQPLQPSIRQGRPIPDQGRLLTQSGGQRRAENFFGGVHPAFREHRPGYPCHRFLRETRMSRCPGSCFPEA
jgi:hypothetical protein